MNLINKLNNSSIPSGIESAYSNTYTRKSNYKMIKKYIKVICIDNNDTLFPLEINKVYFVGYVIGIDNNSKYLIFKEPYNDTLMGFYSKTNFITIAEWRDRQINEILK